MIRLAPSYFAYGDRGAAYLAKSEFDLAIADYTEAIRLYPTYGGHYQSRGLAYLAKGDKDRAIADFRQAIELDPLGSKASRDELKVLVGEAGLPPRKNMLEMLK